MTTTWALATATALPVVLSGFLYIAERKNDWLKNISYSKKQALFGSLFGLLAIWGTEYGITMNGATLNVRDAAPLCAGLIFGCPAGIIAGLIGGVERWFSVLWGAGAYTRLACTLATILAGLFGAAMRWYIFNDKKPSWSYALLISVVVEVLHMLLVFLTNMDDVPRAFGVIELCAVPMIVLNALSVTLTVLLISLIAYQKETSKNETKQISQMFQSWLAAVVTSAFLLTTAFCWIIQTELSRTETETLLQLNIADVRQDIADASDKHLLDLTHRIADDIEALNIQADSLLPMLCDKYDVAEINLIDEAGIIVSSTYPDFVGYDMGGGEQSREFLILLGDADEYVQRYGPVSFDDSISRKYAGVTLETGDFLQVGYDAVHFRGQLKSQVVSAAHNRHIGENGYIVIADENQMIVSDQNENKGNPLDSIGLSLDEQTKEGTYFLSDVYETPSCCMYAQSEGYYIIGVLPQNEAFFSRNASVYLTVFMEIVIFGALFILVYFLIKKLIVENIHKINASLAEITGGNLEVTVNVRSNEEFASLSDDINSTVVTLKRYIAEAAARIDQELEYAKAIQISAMPRVFPPYPNRQEFDIYASMHAAKEVGGDFYDFYLLDENHLAVLVADVSGKGIPAAMFMMTAKTLIKSLAESGLDVHEVFIEANEQLCANNDAGMFVTAWMGIIDLTTGHICFANAGHNPPLVRHKNGTFEFVQSPAGFVLAGLEGIPYKKQELQLEPGDKLYLYTDGVTEATDAAPELYGEDRLKAILNQYAESSVQEICLAVKADIDRFVGDAPQFDDITMLAFERKK